MAAKWAKCILLFSVMSGNVAAKKRFWWPSIAQVLAYSVDCEGNCIGECNRCWVRF
jgi:hypothetical protein